MAEQTIEGNVRTNKLYCSCCNKKLNIGESVFFVLDDTKKKLMQDVFCLQCAAENCLEPDCDHPFSSDALGQ